MGRAEEILEWLENWSTIEELAPWFRCYKTANKWVSRKKEIHTVGQVSFRGTGRPLNVYGVKRWNGLSIKHELILSKFLWPYFEKGLRFRRGYDVDPVLRPDAEVIGQNIYFEMDRGTEGIPKVRRVLAPYANTDGFVFFVTTTEDRVDAVLRQCEGRIFCTTLEWAKEQPFGEIWKDATGRFVSLDI